MLALELQLIIILYNDRSICTRIINIYVAFGNFFLIPIKSLQIINVGEVPDLKNEQHYMYVACMLLTFRVCYVYVADITCTC